MNERHFKDIKGMTVIGTGGRVFGELQDVVIDGGGLRITGLVLRVRSPLVEELGLTRPLWRRARVVVPAEYVSSLGDVVMLNLSVDDYARQLVGAAPEVEPPSAEGLSETDT